MIFAQISFLPQSSDACGKGYFWFPSALGFWKGAHHGAGKGAVRELTQYITTRAKNQSAKVWYWAKANMSEECFKGQVRQREESPSFY